MSIRRVAPDPAAIPPGPPKHRLRAGCLLLFVLVFAAVPSPTIAQQAPPASQRPAGDEAIVSLRINGVTRGEFLVVKAGDDFWMSQEDLAGLKIAFPGGRPGPGFNSLRALGASRLEFQEGELVLQVTFPGESLQGTHVDLGSTPSSQQRAKAPASLILSYRLSHRTLPSGGQQATALNDLNVRVGPLLLRQESRLDSGSQQQHGFTRGRTQAVFDQPEHARRWIAGDVLATAGPFGTSITGAGLYVSKIWTMSPDALRQPRGRIRATTALPAQVELLVDGTTLFRGNVNPGPIEFDNLQYAGGQRDMRLVVTDVSGRRTVIEQPFFFADTALAAGVHDYSYFIGRRSELGSANQWVYKEPAAQAFHRYGATDNVTIGAGGEANADFATLGGGVSLRSDTLGLFSLDLLANRDRVLRRNRTGWAARYTFQTPFFSAIAGLRMFDHGFRSFTANASAFPIRDARLALATTVGPMSYSLEWTRTQAEAETRSTTALRLFRSLGNMSVLSAELRSTVVNGQRQKGLGVIYRHYLDPVNWAGGALDMAGDSRTLTAEVGRQLPEGEGLGYRASLIDVAQPGSHTRTAALNATYNLRPAAIEVSTSTQSGGGGTFGEVALTGAIVAVGGHMGLSRQVGDSFLLARLGVPEPGIEILLNNQVQGRTDARGELFIPNVSAFDRQDVSVNDKQIPMTYQLGRRGVVVAPAYRSGAVVDFDMRRQRAAVGQAWRLREGRRTPVAEQKWTMSGPSGTLTIETSSTGDFYVEDAAPGSYAGQVMSGTDALQCTLVVPQSQEPVQELRGGVTCE